MPSSTQPKHTVNTVCYRLSSLKHQLVCGHKILPMASCAVSMQWYMYGCLAHIVPFDVCGGSLAHAMCTLTCCMRMKAFEYVLNIWWN